MTGKPLISVERFNQLMHTHIPLSAFLGITAEEIGVGSSVLRLPFTPAALRPGGVQNGPSLMALADLAMYAAVMSLCGDDPRPVSSDLSMNFLRRAPNQDLLGRCRVVEMTGKRALLTTGIFPDGDERRMVCFVSANYALP